MSFAENCNGSSYIPPDDPGRCKHGVYVGGSGYDLMCAWCESGTEPYVKTAEDDWRDFCEQWRIIRTLNQIMAFEMRWPRDPDAWAVVVHDPISGMEVAITQAILPDAKRALANYLIEQESTIWVREAQAEAAKAKAAYIEKILGGD